MKKKTFADKLAEKAFNDPKIQQSWNVHMQAFGPILAPAFVDDYKTRVHLVTALNHISRRELNQGIKKLEPIQRVCENDADKAAWLFFMGLCFEMAGEKEQMIGFYSEANSFKHRFYLPYLKVAKGAHNDAVFEIAEENYRETLHCFDGMDLDQQSKMILASVHTNLASCLTMMHRYAEAKEELLKSCEILPEHSERIATEAILYAAMRDEGKAKQCLERLEMSLPELAADMKKTVNDILSDKHAHFSKFPLETEPMNGFWQEFVENEKELREKFDRKDYDAVLSWFTSRLTQLFPFMERPLDFGLIEENGYYQLELADFYSIALRLGYEQLLKLSPDELSKNWRFIISH